ncbi:MAG: radical SAM protein [Candidatus Bathyarchaeota archaeon]|nr:MAG: radical SAM protein [Candidatus Bathyarchaeota archaeon]
MRLSVYKVLSLFKRSLALNKPHHVQWMLTNRCNYRCKSCGVWREKRPVMELSTKKVKEGLNILHRLGVMEIVLSGGNPLLREDIGEIIDYASNHFITTIYDNGSQALRKIEALRKVDFVAISLDTLDEKKYDHLKGIHGAWKNAMNTVQTLHNQGITVGVSPTISQLNMYEILDFTEYFIEREIPVLYCLYQHDSLPQPLFKIGENDKELEIIDKEDLAGIFTTLTKKKRKNRGILITRKMLDTLNELYLTGHRAWDCKALQSFFMIDHLGRVAGCHLQEPVATIFDLPNMWQSQRLERLRKTYQKCTKCSYMCYMFYSLHANVLGNMEIISDQWRNAKTILKRAKN